MDPIKKNRILFLVFGILIIFVLVILLQKINREEPNQTLTPSVSVSPGVSVSASPSPTQTASKSPTPQSSPTPTKSGGIVASPVPWDQLPPEASCELKGEIKYILVNDGPNHNNVYDNQDAIFTYRGIDHPGRVVYWKVTPEDGLKIGPEIFAQIPIPDGESLIGISLPENPNYKKYELTAVINYGRLIDGNIKMFTKACTGKTTVVLP